MGTIRLTFAFARVISCRSIAPIGNDQICYVNDASGWKIGGYIGGGDAQ